MSWEDLLEGDDKRVVLPYFGGRLVHSRAQQWKLRERPRQPGWYEFRVKGRYAEAVKQLDTEGPPVNVLDYRISGYLVGDRLAPDIVNANVPLEKIAELFERVYFIPPSVDRFTRITAGRIWMCGELAFESLAMPLGPEPDVTTAYLDHKVTTEHITGVTPALDAAFRAETFQRAETERARAELERRRAEEDAKRALEEKRNAIAKQLGDGAGRREIARVDFLTAARAALAVGGAELLDWRMGYTRNEYVVTYQVDDERLQCVVDETMQVVSSGICLTDHHTGVSGDTWLTLESLPGVVRQAIREDKLVVFRHA